MALSIKLVRICSSLSASAQTGVSPGGIEVDAMIAGFIGEIHRLPDR